MSDDEKEPKDELEEFDEETDEETLDLDLDLDIDESDEGEGEPGIDLEEVTEEEELFDDADEEESEEAPAAAASEEEEEVAEEAEPEEVPEEPIHAEVRPDEPISVHEVPLYVAIEAGRLKMSLQQLLDLQPGNLLELGVSPESGVNLVVSGKVVGRGELIRVGDALGVRILEKG